MEGLKQDRAELEKLLGQAERDYVKKLLSNEIKKVDAYIVDQETKDVEHEKLQSLRGESEHQKLYSLISKYGWSDEGKNVKVYVTSLDGIKDLASDKINCKFTKSSFELTIQGYNGKDMRLCIPVLSKDIVPEDSKFTIKSSSISITLRKAKDGKWKSLKEGEDAGPGVGGGMPGMGMPGMGMPGMGGSGGMPDFGAMGGQGGMPDFGAMGGEDGMPDFGGMGGAEGGDPNAGLMDMMKKMYDEGDENTRKMMTEAMMKGGADMPK